MPLQFRLRSLFILTAIVAVGCLVGPPIVRMMGDTIPPGSLAPPLIGQHKDDADPRAFAQELGTVAGAASNAANPPLPAAG